MALSQKSRLWDTKQAPLSAHSIPISEEDWISMGRALYARGVANAGIVPSAQAEGEEDDGLKVTITGQTISVKAGQARVHGFHYWLDADGDLDTTIPIPDGGAGTTGHLVVLRANRLTKVATIILSPEFVEGDPSIPPLIQDADTWDIPLWQGTINIGGGVSGTDARVLLDFGTMVSSHMLRTGAVVTRAIDYEAVTEDKAGVGVPAITIRQGFSDTNWSDVGGGPATEQPVAEPVRFTVGTVSVTVGAGNKTASGIIDLPDEYFGNGAVILWSATTTVAVDPDDEVCKVCGVYAGAGLGVTIYVTRSNPLDTALSQDVIVTWHAFGPKYIAP